MEDNQCSINGNILVHIAFFYVASRIKYLIKVLENLKTYHFSEINIIVDTNSEEAEGQIKQLLVSSDGWVTFRVHKDLKDPFYLTWKHRDGMAKNLINYDYFMYLEDDIFVPWKAIQKWHEDTAVIYPFGYVRGFLRVECNAKSELMSTDIRRRFEKKAVLKVLSGRRYFFPPNPYHAFWIYSKEQMVEFMQSQAWIDGNNQKWGVRERAAAGMMWVDPNVRHRALIPLCKDGNILEETFVYHLHNRYGLMNRVDGFGSIPVSKIFLEE